jgi:polyhydroxybutyrate depolymerase
MARAGLATRLDLAQGLLDVGGLHRTYSLARPREVAAGVLVVLHGGGASGAGMAALTGLAERAPRAGFAAVFPDGWNHVWNDRRDASALAHRERIDDAAFIDELIDHVATEGVAEGSVVFAVGISNGAFLAEYLARHALAPLAGIGLVAGTATVVSRESEPRPRQPATVVMFHGTADPLVPYGGGPIGPIGRHAQRGAGPRGRGTRDRGEAVAAEVVAADWAAANGCSSEPTVDQLPASDGDRAVTRMRWSAPAGSDVLLHRIEGGGHTWPGGAQYLPERFVGPVARNLDATGIMLQVFSAVARR